MTDWYDDETFWEDTESVQFTDERRQQASAEVDHILTMTKLPAGASVLDLGCGPGRHALELARHGCRVTGVDRTVRYLEKAANAASEQGLEIEWVEADMRRFRRDGAFDAVVNMLTSFGYFTDPAEDRLVAANILASLKPGGQLVMEMMGKEILARIFRRYDWREEPDGTALLEERRLAEDWSWVDVRWIVIREQQQREHRFGLRVYSAYELKDLLAAVGFAQVAAYGSLEGTPYDHEAKRLVVVARK
ncbi:MAG: methyltransferase domain-containing protein [Phycisphaerales bacterium]|nr:MAG: methyltransferase domain-containing protein [Phycisphaerales bacterium]